MTPPVLLQGVDSFQLTFPGCLRTNTVAIAALPCEEELQDVAQLLRLHLRFTSNFPEQGNRLDFSYLLKSPRGTLSSHTSLKRIQQK